MRSDIQKVICERQRGGSSEKSQKTRLKIDPKQFSVNKPPFHRTYDDYRDYMLEVCATEPFDADIIGDLDLTDFDPGPTYVSSARHRQEGRCSPLVGKKHIFHKRRNENVKPLYRFLATRLGRPWDEIHQEIFAAVNRRSHAGYEMADHIKWAVAHDIVMIDGKPYQCRWGHSYPHTGFYVHPDTGLLCEGDRRGNRYVRPKAPVTDIRRNDNSWYVLETKKDRNLVCGCVHFKVPPLSEEEQKKYGKWYRPYKERPAVCVHGNEPTPRPIWYVKTYGFHKPDDVYRTVHYYEYGAKERYGLSMTNPVHVIYYRDVPAELAKPILLKNKVANKKDLKIIRAYLTSGGENQPSPDVAPKRPSYWV